MSSMSAMGSVSLRPQKISELDRVMGTPQSTALCIDMAQSRFGVLSQAHTVYSMATWSGTPSALICARAERSLGGSLEGILDLEKDSCFKGAHGQLWAPRPDTQGGAKHFCSFSPLLPSSLSHRLFQPFFPLWKPLPHALAWPLCECTSPMGQLTCGSVHCGLFLLLPQE